MIVDFFSTTIYFFANSNKRVGGGLSMKIHLDLDCYYVSAERTRDFSLKDKPVVVVKGMGKQIFSQEKKTCEIVRESGAFRSALEFATKRGDWRDEFVENNRIRGVVIAKSYEAKAYGIKTGMPLSEAVKCVKI